eukprot:3940841-Rhodomonas_salina.6
MAFKTPLPCRAFLSSLPCAVCEYGNAEKHDGFDEERRAWDGVQIWGVLITALDVLLVIFLTQRNLRIVEGIVLALIAVISTSFVRLPSLPSHTHSLAP